MIQSSGRDLFFGSIVFKSRELNPVPKRILGGISLTKPNHNRVRMSDTSTLNGMTPWNHIEVPLNLYIWGVGSFGCGRATWSLVIRYWLGLGGDGVNREDVRMPIVATCYNRYMYTGWLGSERLAESASVNGI